MLDRIVAAVPLFEFSDEHRQDMLARTQALFAGTAKVVTSPKPAAPVPQDPAPLSGEALRSVGLNDPVSHETPDAAE